MQRALARAALLFVFPLYAPAMPLPAPTGSHATQLSCGDCHLDSTPGETLSDRVEDCDACHDVRRNIHPIGIRPLQAVPPDFPLSAEGTLLCRSCHKIHGGDPSNGMLIDVGVNPSRGRAAFCSNCHGLGNMRTNPHSARTGDTRCVFCHIETPMNREQAVSNLRTKIVKLCDFCHGAVGKNHPRNIDPTLSIPDDLALPRDRDGAWNCATCHNPHGTAATTHYVRPEFVRFMERGNEAKPHSADYYTCKSCHMESDEKSIRKSGNALRFQGDISVLCISCHVTGKSHHPTGIAIPDNIMERLALSPCIIPLGPDGRIDCYSCHDNQCSQGEFTMVERYYDPALYRTDLCWACHDRNEYAASNPHTSDFGGCLRCHENRPLEGTDQSLSAVPLMVCLHCHEIKPHPEGIRHLVKPDGIKIRVDPSLPLSKAGEISCITCHEPHEDPEDKKMRLRVKSPEIICNFCHVRK